MKKLIIILALFAALVGAVVVYRSWSEPKQRFHSETGELLPANPKGLPKWGKTSFYGEFILVERGPDGKARVYVLFARKAKKGWMPKDLIAGLKVQSLEESSGDKMIIGGLYKDIDEIGFFTTKSLPDPMLSGEVYELAVSDGDRLFRVKGMADNPILKRSVEIFKKAFAKSQEGR
ncbi:MAG: hypothetical protein P1V97_13265 [Planctomycetota bacterium]|nr:hypothetical protein [Planctomycetota bacterium]